MDIKAINSTNFYQPSASNLPRKNPADNEVCITSTDKVDNEIANLKNKQAKLLQQINSVSNPEKISELNEELARIENELRQKDNDTYRRQNAEISSGVDVQA